MELMYYFNFYLTYLMYCVCTTLVPKFSVSLRMVHLLRNVWDKIN